MNSMESLDMLCSNDDEDTDNEMKGSDRKSRQKVVGGAAPSKKKAKQQPTKVASTKQVIKGSRQIEPAANTITAVITGDQKNQAHALDELATTEENLDGKNINQPTFGQEEESRAKSFETHGGGIYKTMSKATLIDTESGEVYQVNS